MRTTNHTTDPWNRRKTEMDPWDSPWRKKHERTLQRGKGTALDEDCAFGLHEHHRKSSDCAFDTPAHHTPNLQHDNENTHSPRRPVVLLAVILLIIIVFGILDSNFLGYGIYPIYFDLHAFLFVLFELFPFLFTVLCFVFVVKNGKKKK